MQNPIKKYRRRKEAEAIVAAAEARHQHALDQIAKAGFWFVDIPRTSSSSLKVEIGQKFGAPFGKSNLIESEFSQDHVIPDHQTARVMRNDMGAERWQDLYSFTIVRNPWDRARSLFYYLKKRSEIPEHWTFPDWIRLLADRETAAPFPCYDPIRYTASDFILDKDNMVLVDEVVRFENREVGIAKIAERIGIGEGLGSLKLQASGADGRDYRNDYDPFTRDLIGQSCARDIALFGYDF